MIKKILNFFSRLFNSGSSSSKNNGPTKTTDLYAGSGTKKSLNQLISDAFDQSLKPVLYFHADWCGASVKFKAGLSDPRMQAALEGSTLIIIDSDLDMDQDKVSVAYHIRHVPTFIRVNRDGSAIKAITGAEWGADVIENMAPVMKTFLA